MTSEEFLQLDIYTQFSSVFEDGKMIDERAIYNKSTIELYRLHNFYVEVFFDVNNGKIQTIELITEDTILYWYADITELLLNSK